MTVCTYCGRDSEPGAQFCIDCGKPLTKAAALQRAAAESGRLPAPATPEHPTVTTKTPRPSTRCPHCGASLPPAGPRTDFRFTLVLVDTDGDELERFACNGPDTTIGREGGDLRFADDAFLSPLHARLSWEESGLVVRDLGSRTHLSPGRDVYLGRERGDWVFPYDQTMSAQHALVRSEDADFVVVDQSSRNGVALAARGAMPLTDGSRLLVGDNLLLVELAA